MILVINIGPQPQMRELSLKPGHYISSEREIWLSDIELIENFIATILQLDQRLTIQKRVVP
jgi:hypothetical protein